MAALDPSSLSVSYRHTQDLAQYAPGTAQTWYYEVSGHEVSPARRAAVQIGHGDAILVDLYGVDPYGSLDSFDAHVHRIRAAAMDPVTRELDKSWGEDLDMCGDRLLVLNGLRLGVPGHHRRARWLAPLISALVITRLAHCAVAVVYAPRDGGDDTADVDAMRDAGLEFWPLRDGVHYLDPAGLDLSAVLRGAGSRPSVSM
jgi:hypothetical protein